MTSPVRTSITDPIRVDFLPNAPGAPAGRIGLTLAPGKKDPGGQWDRDLGEDVRRLRKTFGASLLVSLIEEHELKLLGIEDLAWEAHRAQMRFHPLPIVDGGVPGRVDEVVALVQVILAVVSAGDNVVIHCRGGLGRSGLIAGCCLVAQGVGADEAIRIVRKSRRDAIENRHQEAFIRSFGETWRGARPIEPSASRILGCLLGGALGDALGYPIEFCKTAREIERVLGPVVPERLPHVPGKRALVSDDTQMTLFTAEGLVRACQRSLDRGICSMESVLLRSYHRWLSTQVAGVSGDWQDPERRGWLLDIPELHARREPGRTCLSALAATLDARNLPTVEAPPNDRKGCGAVMRSAPIGLAAASAEEAFRVARNAGVLTHGHPSGYLSAAYFAAVVHGVARAMPLADAMACADRLLEEESGGDEVAQAVDLARAGALEGKVTRETIERLGGGWVGEEALGIALLCALTIEDGTQNSVATSLWKAVAHGGDSDSTGSLTGNLLGAMFGRESLPEAWLADLELREVIERMALDLHATFVLKVEPELGRYPPN
jgi:ADP-ribosylglycohydrolase/protein-tyrosine phosphatase